MNRPRRPAFRTPKLKPHEKPLFFIKEKWQAFRKLSRKKQIIIVGGSMAAVMVLIPVFSYLYFIRDISNQERLMNRNNTGIVITDRHDEVIYSYGKNGNDRIVPLEEISDDLEKALIASEDKKFYEHGGYSFKSIAAALYANISNKDLKKYGGSTLTQQLIKNNLLTSNKSFLRKYQELSLAIAIERHYTKDQILEMYLNSVYFGEGAFGIEQAADIYFDKKPDELTLAESSMLIGILPAPSAYSPISGDIEEAKSQQERVLTQMTGAGFIKEPEIEAILNQKLSYAEPEIIEQDHAHHFTQMVVAELSDRYGEEKVTRSGFKVKTGLDLGWQKEAEKLVAQQVSYVRSQGATNAAMVAIDPKTGEIRALVGSIDWNNEQFGQVNMALTPRQPGSSFKPIYFAEGFDQKLITPSTIIRDEAKTYGGDYNPQNYDFRFRGNITVRHALATSLNIPAIEVLQKVGVVEASEAARRMGISTVTEPEKYGLTLALGTAETKLLEMTNAYAGFANQGSQYQAGNIINVENKYNKVIYTSKSKPKQIISPQAAYLVSSILSDNDARAPTFGSKLNLYGRTAAVKTGTTNDNKDAWTIGYTPSLAVGVWVGDNTHKPMQLGGSAAAGPIWKGSMEYMLKDTSAEDFVKPKGITAVLVCNINGTYNEYFISGTEPTEKCSLPKPAPEPKKDDKEEEERRKREEEKKKQEEEQESNEETTPEPDSTEEPAASEDEEQQTDPDLSQPLDPLAPQSAPVSE